MIGSRYLLLTYQNMITSGKNILNHEVATIEPLKIKTHIVNIDSTFNSFTAFLNHLILGIALIRIWSQYIHVPLFYLDVTKY